MCQFIETIRIEDGQVYNLSYHTARMNRTRAAFWKEAAPIDLSGFISPPSLSGIWKCRIVYVYSGSSLASGDEACGTVG